MDLSLSEDELLLQSSVQAFVRKAASTEVLTSLQDNEPGYRAEWTRPMVDAGWTGILVPEALGGAGATALEAALVCEELGRGPLPGPFLASSVVSALLLQAAPAAESRDSVLREIAAGSAVVAPVLALADQEWDGLPVATAASGTFPFVPYAGAATHILLLRDGAEPGTVDLVLVPASNEGVRWRLLTGFLAWNYEVEITEEAVQDATIIPGCTSAAARSALLQAGVLSAAYQVGGCQAVLDRSIEYSNTRIQFSVPIGKFQRVQDHIVELLNAVDAARWTTYEAIWKIDTGAPSDASAHLAKATASESYLTSTDYAHKVHGGIGVDPQYGLTLYTQMARSLYEFLGHPRWHRRQMLDALIASSVTS
jgi:alkylation response protein AidB-like acyl-CoA dehydrogenase